jgi:ribose/xylose/arabinose/galactoside ABC-type transport system permease subunit
MTWVRSNIKCVSRIALLAMAIQFALSFGHFHAISYAATSAPQVSSTLSKLSFAGGLADWTADTQSARRPASNHDLDEHAGDICAICAVMAMVKTALFATPPVLRSPQVIEFSYLTTKGEFARVASVRIAFQPRAPPIS